ncbi:MAG TPA: cysteine desulfurase family protein [Candidatus Saccharimonadales bacterium]|nr:cysteine desulfurase family protein [Candidatus Saccharimonadales bacterium]
MVYFDWNATAPMLPAAKQAWLDAVDRYIGNPSSPHRLGARAETAMNEARASIASHLGCVASEIVWTSGATESSNMVLHHFWRTLDSTSEVWTSSLEHPCVLEASSWYFQKRHRFIPARRSGVVDLDWISTQLRQTRPGVIAVMAANNETGVLQPWREVLDLCRKQEIPFFCDAAQWLGKLPAHGLGQCDFVSGCGHKFGGPKGAGFLKVPSRFVPLLVGGKQEDGYRAGTENVPGVISMATALDHREQQLSRKEHCPLGDVKSKFERQLLEALPHSSIVGIESARLWNTVSALMPDADCQQRWVVKLDKLGFAVSTGSACSSGQEKPSHVLTGMGFSPAETSRVLRFSGGWETSSAEWEQLLTALKEVHARLSEQPEVRVQEAPLKK